MRSSRSVHPIFSDTYYMYSINYNRITNTHICSRSAAFQGVSTCSSEGESVAKIREYAA